MIQCNPILVGFDDRLIFLYHSIPERLLGLISSPPMCLRVSHVFLSFYFTLLLFFLSFFCLCVLFPFVRVCFVTVDP